MRIKSLREILRDARIMQYQLAIIVKVDPSMISYVASGGRCSVDLATMIACSIVKSNPDAEMDVSMWMLSLGFAPPWLVSATRQQVNRAREAVGGAL